MERINAVGYKGQCRRCISCGDVKIWDYPNERNCPKGLRHKWRPVDGNNLTEKENKSIKEQVRFDKENIKHRSQIIINNEKDAERIFRSHLKDFAKSEGKKNAN